MKFSRFSRLLLLSLATALTAPLLFSCASRTDPAVSAGESEDEPSDPLTVTVGEQSYPVQAVNRMSEAPGVYLYDPSFGVCASAPDGDFTDYVVAGGIVVLAGEPGVPAILTDSGYVVRFFHTAPEAAPVIGTEVSCGMQFADPLPAHCVRFGEVVIEIGYRNTPRTNEATGFLFDDGWYAATTCSNAYGTEIAVQDGKVVAVNRSGSEHAGDTPIPDGGFVLSVVQGSVPERQLANVAVGDDAELVDHEPLYSVTKYGISGADRSRPTSGIVLYTTGKTPEGSALTEVTVEADGRISAIHSDSAGETEVPVGGFVISAAGDAAVTVARRTLVGTFAVRTGSAIHLVSTPDTYAARASEELAALRAAYEADKQALAHIDYRAADDALRAAEEALSPAPDTEARVDRLTKLEGLLSVCRAAVVPSLTVQNRAAWVTVGELYPDDSFLLHYRNETEVRHAVEYAVRIGLNTLIIDNTISGYAAYPSQVEGMVMLPELGGFDVVQAFSDVCREKGLRLIVMVCGLSSFSSTHAYPDAHYSKLLADCLLVSNRGNKVDAGSTSSLDPSREQSRAFQCAVLEELIEKYEIDGIQVDYIRYPLPIYYQAHNYEDFGYQSPASEAFQKQYGVDPATLSINDERWADWCTFRRGVITDYARQLSETVKAADETLEVSFTCFADHNDRQVYVYQDVELWAKEGFADAIYPMIYGDTTEYQSSYAAQTASVAEDAGLMLGVGLYVRASHQSITEQLYMPFSFSADGVSLFTLRYVSYCGYDETVRTAFRMPAAPAGNGEETVRACVAFLADRADALAYLFPEESALSSLAGELRALSAPESADAAALTALVEAHLPADETLRDAMQADLRYVLRFLP